MKFTDLHLDPAILKALKRMNYTDLTPIQERTFPHILAGKDLIATAETGSGKTSACGIPLIQRTDSHQTSIQVLVLVPTRELALQYVDEINRIGQDSRIIPFAIYGGFDADIQRAKLRDLVHILIATPGRLIDLIYSGDISLSQVKTCVLDEADEMLKQGFLEDIDFIFSCLVHQHQTLLFSATMPPEIIKLARTFLKEPVVIELNKEEIAPQSLVHRFLFVSQQAKLDSLLRIIPEEKITQAIIFCNSRNSAERLFDRLRNSLSALEMIHGGFEQERRASIIRRFRSGQTRFLVATDLAGRGLDFSRVSHVINYDFPFDQVSYTHRTGRTGRMGQAGIALTFVSGRDLNDVQRLIKRNRIQAQWLGTEPDFSRPRQGKRFKTLKRPDRNRRKAK
ncbi:DEAD/DEAH box helicase [bacterium]|nr:DEAD/DEAH box helicase [bacterium]